MIKYIPDTFVSSEYDWGQSNWKLNSMVRRLVPTSIHNELNTNSRNIILTTNSRNIIKLNTTKELCMVMNEMLVYVTTHHRDAWNVSMCD